QDGAAGLDLVAVLEVGVVDRLAVDEGAVVAAQVDQPAVRRVDVEQEVDAREVAVLARQPEVGQPGAADQDAVASADAERAAEVRPLDHFEGDEHGAPGGEAALRGRAAIMPDGGGPLKGAGALSLRSGGGRA